MHDATAVHRGPAKVLHHLLSVPAGMAFVAVAVSALLLALVTLATLAQQRLEAEEERVLVGERLRALQGTLIREMPPALTVGEGIRNFVVDEGGISGVWFTSLAGRFTRDEALIRGVLLLRRENVVQAYPDAFLPLIGQNLGREPGRAAALALARRTRQSLTVGPLPALTRSGESLNTFVPVFGRLPGADRNDDYWGAVRW